MFLFIDMDDIESGGDSISTGTLITIVFVAIILFVVVLFAALYALYKRKLFHIIIGYE